MGTKIVASFCLVFLSFCLFFGHNEALEVINLNWARVLGSNTEVQNCTEGCDGVCGNGRCEANESPCNCPCDCGFCCKDGFCRHDKGETFENCPSDCEVPNCGDDCDGVCRNGRCEATESPKSYFTYEVYLKPKDADDCFSIECEMNKDEKIV
eukprot:TRINITY_DN1034_c0_g2_i7.p1 TRINITY_DN1034_c0_g2~~TRINITY_DN1034_c0_g2_i7.p1  ORF type:complete len:153 (-),score=41.77 TRINITY_DN1034_c0_g2_i7:649-1107(-)